MYDSLASLPAFSAASHNELMHWCFSRKLLEACDRRSACGDVAGPSDAAEGNEMPEICVLIIELGPRLAWRWGLLFDRVNPLV